MEEIIDDFLEDEVSVQEAYSAIRTFILSENIRCGEYEGNRYIIKKMDLVNFIIFVEDIYPDNSREICNCISIYKNKLLDVIDKFASKEGMLSSED